MHSPISIRGKKEKQWVEEGPIPTYLMHIHHSRSMATLERLPALQKCYCKVITVRLHCYLHCRLPGKPAPSKELRRGAILLYQLNGKMENCYRQRLYQAREVFAGSVHCSRLEFLKQKNQNLP